MKLCWGEMKLKKREAKRMRRRYYCIRLHNNSVWSLIYSNIISDRRTQHNTRQLYTLQHEIQFNFNSNSIDLNNHDAPVLSLLCQMSDPSSFKVLLLIKKIAFSFFFNLFCHGYVHFYSFFYFFSSFLQSLGMFFLLFYHRIVFPSLPAR